MSDLHSNAPAHSLKATKQTIGKAFNGMPFEDIFEEFHEKPLGVGAIAQVYKAKLKPSLAAVGGTDLDDSPPNIRQILRRNVDVLVKSTPQRVPSSYVAIKVLHPTVERVVRRDLRIMTFFASILNAVPTLEWLSFPDEVLQFGEMMRLQLDLRIESANLTIFRKKFKDRTTAGFPTPYPDYTTREVLVEEFASGIPLAAFLEDGGGVFQHEIADEGLDSFLHMLLIDNFVHADLHPGNIMVRFYKPEQLTLAFGRHKESDNPDQSTDVTEQVLQKLRPHRHKPDDWVAALAEIDHEGYRPQLIFIDTGLVTSLNDVNRKNFLDLFKAIAEFDGYRAGHLMVSRCRQPDAVIDPEVFALKMQHLVLGVKSRTFALGNIKIGDILNEVLGMVRAHHVRMEGDFVNVVISILLLEGIGRTLDPGLDLFKRYVLTAVRAHDLFKLVLIHLPLSVALNFPWHSRLTSSPHLTSLPYLTSLPNLPTFSLFPRLPVPAPRFFAQLTLPTNSALPILRQLGTAGSGRSLLDSIRSGDFSMLKVWVGLEARGFLRASAEDVERCVKYDLLSPNF